jgi:hypothetical protein
MMRSEPFTVYVDVNSGRKSSRFGQQVATRTCAARRRCMRRPPAPRAAAKQPQKPLDARCGASSGGEAGRVDRRAGADAQSAAPAAVCCPPSAGPYRFPPLQLAAAVLRHRLASRGAVPAARSESGRRASSPGRGGAGRGGAGQDTPGRCATASCRARAFVVCVRAWCGVDVPVPSLCCACAQLVSSRMGMIGAALAVTMLLAVALSGSDEGSGLAIKSAKLAAAKAPSQLSLKRMEKVPWPSSLLAILLARLRCRERASTTGRSRPSRMAIARPGCAAARRRRDVVVPGGAMSVRLPLLPRGHTCSAGTWH